MGDEELIEAALARGAGRLPEGMKVLAEAVCGCCDSGATWDPLFEELERLDRCEYRGEDLAAVLVDHLGLSEHGVSIRGGWLTERGREALSFLREHGLDWRDDGLEYVDSEGCSWGIDEAGGHW